MKKFGSLTLVWAGGEHAFHLPIGGLRAVQDRCNAGPQEVLARLSSGKWRVDDPLAVLTHGLRGAGMDDQASRDLVNSAVDQYGLMQLVVTAATVLTAALVGVDGDPVGEVEGVNQSPESGGSAATMVPAQ